ncbi:hypothetical protein [Nocardia sp. NPDC006630]|uniref:hypothetical protein n=1 Tax=Nocardia sp. NPDC006630 TaxID=3157181 RepID=UPI0033BAD3D6
MSPTAVSSRPSTLPARALGLLTALAVVLGIAVFLAPPLLASIGSTSYANESAIRDAFTNAFVDYWAAGQRDYTPALDQTIDYWMRFHLAKAAIALVLLAVLVTLSVLLWKAFLRSGNLSATRRSTLASTGAVTVLLALFALLLVIANIQGTFAPFSSLLSMLPMNTADPELARTLTQINQQLADSQGAPAHTPPLDVMITDFARYHAILAVVAATVAIALIGTTILFWRRFTRSSDGRTRRVLASFGTLSTLLSLTVVVLAAVNASTAAHSAPALAGFFAGGW